MHTNFVADTQALEKQLQQLKHTLCPFCRRTGNLNRHSRIKGNDPERVEGSVLRGQRAYCSDRGSRNGCGRTFPLFLAHVLPRHTFTARLLWKALADWLKGASIKASWEAAGQPLTLDTFYHLLQRLRRKLHSLRSVLHRQRAPPEICTADPLRQTFEHVRHLFATDTCPLEAFQLQLQRSLVG
jgi:hypothetical protein